MLSEEFHGRAQTEPLLFHGDETIMCCSPSKFKIRLHDWIGSKPNLVLGGNELSELSTLCYLGSYTSPNGGVSDTMSSRTQRPRSVFLNLKPSVVNQRWTSHCKTRFALWVGSMTFTDRYTKTVGVLTRCFRTIPRIW